MRKVLNEKNKVFQVPFVPFSKITSIDIACWFYFYIDYSDLIRCEDTYRDLFVKFPLAIL